jgi:hypothetical protein
VCEAMGLSLIAGLLFGVKTCVLVCLDILSMWGECMYVRVAPQG